jgi:parvulin-like peptidyl-prolyl isomerase
MEMAENMENFERNAQEEPKDRTRLLWAAVALVLALMMGALWFSQKPKPNVSGVRAKHILIRYDANDPADRNRAIQSLTSIRERILKGERFDALAREYSEDTMSARRGGDLGWSPRGAYSASFDQYCWSADVGKLSDIISTEHGFHLIVVTDRIISDIEKYETDLEKRTQEKQKEGTGGSAGTK